MRLSGVLFLLLLQVNNLPAQETYRDSLGNQVRDGVIYFKKLLPEYEIDACFQLILNVVVDAERNGGYVNKSRFYSLVAQRRVKGDDTVSYLHINPDRWLLSHEMDYAGFLIIRGVYFLLRGDVESCGLLKKCEGVGDITVEANIGAYFRTRPLKVRKGRK